MGVWCEIVEEAMKKVFGMCSLRRWRSLTDTKAYARIHMKWVGNKINDEEAKKKLMELMG